jgi:hypothetical protein
MLDTQIAKGFSMNPNNDLLDQAASLADMGRLSEARALVKQALQNDDRDTEAWYALIQLAENDMERRKAIYQLWSLDPNHPEANFLLDKLKAGTLAPLDGKAAFGSRKVQADKKPAKGIAPKDYLMPAIYTLLAYWFIWFVGLGLNLYYLNEAGRLQGETGIRQENVGCLKALAGVYIALPLIALGFALLLLVFGQI